MEESLNKVAAFPEKLKLTKYNHYHCHHSAITILPKLCDIGITTFTISMIIIIVTIIIIITIITTSPADDARISFLFILLHVKLQPKHCFHPGLILGQIIFHNLEYLLSNHNYELDNHDDDQLDHILSSTSLIRKSPVHKFSPVSYPDNKK